MAGSLACVQYPSAQILGVSTHPGQKQLTLTLAIDTVVLQAIMFDRALTTMLQCTEQQLDEATSEPVAFARVMCGALEGVNCSVRLQPRQTSATARERGQEKDPKVVSLVPHEPLMPWAQIAAAL